MVPRSARSTRYNEDGLKHIPGQAITPLKKVFYAVLPRQYLPLPWKKSLVISATRRKRNPHCSVLSTHVCSTVKGKCKAIPLQAWTGPECSRSLRLPDFKAIGTLRR